MFSLIHLAKRLIRSSIVVVLCCGSATVTVAQGDEPPSSAAAVRTLYLVRHGAYNRTSDAEDFTGNALIPLGIAQARLAGARLRSLPVRFDALYSSTMTRAWQSASVIGEEFPDLKLQRSALLAECTPTTWRQDIMQSLDEGEAEACENQLDKAFTEFFKPAANDTEHDILVFHGNAIRYLVTKVLRVDTNAWLGMGIGHASITVVQVKPDGAMKLLSFGDVGHLAQNMQTGYGGKPRQLVVPSLSKP